MKQIRDLHQEAIAAAGLCAEGAVRANWIDSLLDDNTNPWQGEEIPAGPVEVETGQRRLILIQIELDKLDWINRPQYHYALIAMLPDGRLAATHAEAVGLRPDWSSPAFRQTVRAYLDKWMDNQSRPLDAYSDDELKLELRRRNNVRHVRDMADSVAALYQAGTIDKATAIHHLREVGLLESDR